jgi:hypothetical protein
VRSEVVWLLVALDKEFAWATPELRWPEWYAERIVEQFAV